MAIQKTNNHNAEEVLGLIYFLRKHKVKAMFFLEKDKTTLTFPCEPAKPIKFLYNAKLSQITANTVIHDLKMEFFDYDYYCVEKLYKLVKEYEKELSVKRKNYKNTNFSYKKKKSEEISR